METERLTLRPLSMEDLPALYNILSDAETMAYYPSPFDMDRTRNWIAWNLQNYQRYGFGLWGVVLREKQQLIGDCGITMQNILGRSVPEIGYHIDKRFWKQGYATEAARACLRYAFDYTDFQHVYSYMKSANLASRRVAEKMGMTLYTEYPDENNLRTSVYRISKSEYLPAAGK